MKNKLYLGDNLEVMRQMKSELIDLCITDPPFYSRKNYGAFDDKWHSLNDYLEFMKPRLIEMHRLLKETGSLYLQCDNSASHYLKIELDKIFGYPNFRNEIIWKVDRLSRKSKHQFPRSNDSIFFYSKCKGKNVFYPQLTEYKCTKRHERGYYSFSSYGEKILLIYDEEKAKKADINLEKYDKIGYPKSDGAILGQVWTDINFLRWNSKEKVDYPTQKPIKLYQRIIKASSNEGDIVLDPFAGSGTALDAAQSLNRRFIGIDQGQEAINVIKQRFKENYGLLANYEFIEGNK